MPPEAKTKLALALAGGLGYFGVGFDATAHKAPSGFCSDFNQRPRRPQRASNRLVPFQLDGAKRDSNSYPDQVGTALGKLNGGGRDAATED